MFLLSGCDYGVRRMYFVMLRALLRRGLCGKFAAIPGTEVLQRHRKHQHLLAASRRARDMPPEVHQHPFLAFCEENLEHLEFVSIHASITV